MLELCWAAATYVPAEKVATLQLAEAHAEYVSADKGIAKLPEVAIMIDVDNIQETEQEAVVPVTLETLQAGMGTLVAELSSWDDQRFTRVKQLQEAKRNQGSVELMIDGGTFLAVKKMPTKWMRSSPAEFDEQHPESSEKPWLDAGVVRHLNAIRYPYAVKLIGIFVDGDSTYVASSLASEGDLFTWCECAPKPGLKREAGMHPLVTQIFTGVSWLHDLGIAHRDLSLENILLHKEGDGLKIKIIDFGMCTLNRTVSAELRGKPSYQPPEMHRAAPLDTFTADSFAVGVILFAMGAHDYPWTSTKRKTCELWDYVSVFGLKKFLSKRKQRNGNGRSLAEVFSSKFVDLLTGLLAPDPVKRLTLGERCFESEDSQSPGRSSVWDCKWVERVVEVSTLEVACFETHNLCA